MLSRSQMGCHLRSRTPSKDAPSPLYLSQETLRRLEMSDIMTLLCRAETNDNKTNDNYGEQK
jgi:hypothetical protein